MCFFFFKLSKLSVFIWNEPIKFCSFHWFYNNLNKYFVNKWPIWTERSMVIEFRAHKTKKLMYINCAPFIYSKITIDWSLSGLIVFFYKYYLISSSARLIIFNTINQTAGTFLKWRQVAWDHCSHQIRMNRIPFRLLMSSLIFCIFYI